MSNLYTIIFYNRFAHQTQVFKVDADSEEEAEKKFYINHPKPIYKECIESVIHECPKECKDCKKLLEEKRKLQEALSVIAEGVCEGTECEKVIKELEGELKPRV